MSTRSTPKKTPTRKRVIKRSSKSVSRLREERVKRNADKTGGNKKVDYWSKMEEVLNHLALVGLGDSVPPPIQQAVKQKLAASRRVLLKKGDPLDITKPLLDLSNIVSDHGIKTGAVVNRHVSGIKFFMEEATKENIGKSLVSLTTKKDTKGIEMKKMLDRAKTILNQLSDMNELRLAIKNAVDTILKTTGYLMDNQTSHFYRVETEYDKVGLLKSLLQPEADLPFKTYNWKKIEGVLDHVMRVCQRPNIARDLQQTMMAKVCASRKFFLRRSDPVKICKPLHELIDVLNRHGLQSSEAAKAHLEDVQAWSISTIENEDFNSNGTSCREKNCLEVRKALGQAKTSLNYLSELNDLKMIIKNSVDLIQKGGIFTVDDLPSILADEDYDSLWDVGSLVRDLDKVKLPNNLKVAIKVTMSRLKKILTTHEGNVALQDHLEVLRQALRKRTPEDVAVACYALIAAVTDYQSSR